MSTATNIQWCDATYNVAVGCEKDNEDCKNCYMYRQSLGKKRYDPNKVRRTTTVFNMPLKYKETESKVWPGRPLVFTSSLTDLFIKQIDLYRHEVFEIMKKCPHLIFQILTKRSDRLPSQLPADWGKGPENIWLGTSVGSNKRLYKIDELLANPAHLHFVSLEPLHGPVDLEYRHRNLKWIIVGGESGNDNGPYGYRPCQEEWIHSIINFGYRYGIPVFVKQMGTHLAKKMGMKDRHGGDINEFPNELKIRQFPDATYY